MLAVPAALHAEDAAIAQGPLPGWAVLSEPLPTPAPGSGGGLGFFNANDSLVHLEADGQTTLVAQRFTLLNPQARGSTTLSYTQPLLQGAGVGPNLAPIVIARINTERSYFQFKDAVQELVRGVIEAYWAVVFARTDVWARRQQVEQSTAAYERAWCVVQHPPRPVCAVKHPPCVFTAVGCTVQGQADKDAVVAHCLEEFKAKVGGCLTAAQQKQWQ